MSAWTLRAVGHSTPQEPDLPQVRQALAILADPTAGLELRGLPSGRSIVVAGDDLNAAAAAAQQLSDDRGVYYCLNPIPVGLDHAARVGDVLRRRWLLIDVDAAKPAQNKDDSSTEAEHEAAREQAEEIMDWLTGQEWPLPVVVDSGNGWHLLYRIDLPNDRESQTLLRDCLYQLANRFNGERGAVDRVVHNASRISKLPGTWARKGPDTAERPHRLCRLVHAPAEVQVVPTDRLRQLAGTTSQESSAGGGSRLKLRASDDRGKAYARSGMERELARVAMAPVGERNSALNRAAFSLGGLVAAGLLDKGEVELALLFAADRAGLQPAEIRATIASGLNAGMAQPRTLPEPEAAPREQAVAQMLPEITIDDIATIDDLKRAGAQVEWAWEGWIQIGVLTAIAAKGGTGKTRFCADLLRRIRQQLPWPDGKPMHLSPDTLSLWVVADNHHDELVSLSESFGITDLIRLNASKSDPYGGVSLDEPADLAALEARVKLCRPTFVIVDTVGNATDRNLSRQEDAKAFYWPLQVIARKYRCSVLCLTHLNATGHFLGRRVLEKVRVAIRMEQPDPESDRRRLEVCKSNSRRPAALGVSMGDLGNEYDDNPPAPATDDGAASASASSGRPGPPPAKLRECADWLQARLSVGPARVSITRNEAEAAGFSAKTLYRAKDLLHVEEYESEGRKWWRLAADEIPM